MIMFLQSESDEQQLVKDCYKSYCEEWEWPKEHIVLQDIQDMINNSKLKKKKSVYFQV